MKKRTWAQDRVAARPSSTKMMSTRDSTKRIGLNAASVRRVRVSVSQTGQVISIFWEIDPLGSILQPGRHGTKL